MNLILARFGDVPVLAKKAAHVAAGGSHAEDARAGKKMIERFLFDRIDLQRGGRTVPEAEKFSAAIHADKTETGLPVMNAAMARAKKTVNAIARLRFPPARFVKRFRVKRGAVCQNRELGHEFRSALSIRCCGVANVARRMAKVAGLHRVTSVALSAAAFGGPVDKTFQAVAIFPREAEKF